ncbi:hypothetical protein GCM10023224_26740 [Streptomonospora halophila]|uniref:DUF2087 domain-containing protein n=1 Tax=Streptomonospora halophila TaxID=427369 RepID=A0ABP9GK18_9ACTN
MTAHANPLLRLLQERYGERWSIRRTEHLWLATVRTSDVDHAPTLVEPDVEEFVRQLENPPTGAGRSLLSAGWFRAQTRKLGDGCYRVDGPPMT